MHAAGFVLRQHHLVELNEATLTRVRGFMQLANDDHFMCLIDTPKVLD